MLLKNYRYFSRYFGRTSKNCKKLRNTPLWPRPPLTCWRPVKPYRTPPSRNIETSATLKCCGVVFYFFLCIFFFTICFFSIEKFVILRVKYYPLLLHLQKCDAPKFEFVAETGGFWMDICCMVQRLLAELQRFCKFFIWTYECFWIQQISTRKMVLKKSKMSPEKIMYCENWKTKL